MPVWYLKLRHPSGRKTTKKYKTKLKSPKAVKRKYYGTAHHFNSEASVTGMSRRKRKRRKQKKRKKRKR